MKFLLLQATSRKVLTKERCRHVGQTSRSPKGHFSSSGDESTKVDSSKEGYTSRAFNTDDEPGSLSYCLETGKGYKQHGIRLQLAFKSMWTPLIPHEKLPRVQEVVTAWGIVPLCLPSSRNPTRPWLPRVLLENAGDTLGAQAKWWRRRTLKEYYWQSFSWLVHLTQLKTSINFIARFIRPECPLYSKGAREIVRHYQSESHLRKDQLWRYTHLSRKNENTGVVTHQVRGRNGVLLTPLELEKEKPLFEEALLVDIGGGFPHYEDYLARSEGRLTTADARDSTQIALIATMNSFTGDMNLLHALWHNSSWPFGTYMNYQEAFAPFDWGPTKLTVSIFLYSDFFIVPFMGLVLSFYLGDFPSHLHLWDWRHLEPNCC